MCVPFHEQIAAIASCRVDVLTKDSVVDMQYVSICASSLHLRLKKAEVQQEAKMIGLLWKTRPRGFLRDVWLKLVKTVLGDTKRI